MLYYGQGGNSMRKVKTFFNVELPYFLEKAKMVATVIFYQTVIVFVVFGVLYISNYKITITPNVQIVSPIGK